MVQIAQAIGVDDPRSTPALLTTASIPVRSENQTSGLLAEAISSVSTERRGPTTSQPASIKRDTLAPRSRPAAPTSSAHMLASAFRLRDTRGPDFYWRRKVTPRRALGLSGPTL